MGGYLRCLFAPASVDLLALTCMLPPLLFLICNFLFLNLENSFLKYRLELHHVIPVLFLMHSHKSCLHHNCSRRSASQYPSLSLSLSSHCHCNGEHATSVGKYVKNKIGLDWIRMEISGWGEV